MKIAMFGTGNYANAHLSVLSAISELDIVGHVSPTPAHREEAARRWGGRAYATPADLLAHEKVDAAWIAVPPDAHGAIEDVLIDLGIPFFVEKPLSADRETAERIGARIDERELVAGVGYKWRALDVLPEVQEVLTEHPVRAVLATYLGPTPAPTWWRRLERSGGQVVEQATHLLDLARHLVGEATVLSATADRRPRAAFPDVDVPSTTTALLRFETGAHGVFTASCVLDGTEEIRVKLICEGLLVTIGLDGAKIERGRERRELRVQEDLLAGEDRAFLEAVRTGDPERPLSSYADALRTHRLCFDVVEASGTPATGDEEATS